MRGYEKANAVKKPKGKKEKSDVEEAEDQAE
jgi:hypothetical protein